MFIIACKMLKGNINFQTFVLLCFSSLFDGRKYNWDEIVCKNVVTTSRCYLWGLKLRVSQTFAAFFSQDSNVDNR